MIFFFLETFGTISETCSLFFLNDVDEIEKYANVGKAIVSVGICFNFLHFFVDDITPTRQRVAVCLFFVLLVHILEQGIQYQFAERTAKIVIEQTDKLLK